MADIKVSLILDDKEYTGKLEQAGAKAQEFASKSKQATDHAGGGLEQLGHNVESIKGKFEALTVAILGVGLAEFAKSALEYADHIEDMAKANGLAISTTLEFTKAMAAAGGSSENASKALGTLMMKIDAAAQGAYATQVAFGRVGVTINDLATLSNKDILIKTVEGLAKTNDASARVALATELFGKAMRGLPIQEVDEKLKEYLGTMGKQEEAIQRGADANKRMENAIVNLKIAFIDVFGDFFEHLGKLGQDSGEATKIIIQLTSAFVALFAVGVAARFLEIAAAIKEFAVAMNIARAASGWIGLLATALGALAVYWGVNSYLTDQNTKSLEKYNSEEEREARATKAAKEEAERKAESQRKIYQQTTALTNSLKQLTDQQELQRAQTIRNLALDAAYVGMGENEARSLKARIAAYDQYVQQRNALQGKLEAAEAAGPDSPEKGMIGKYKKALEDLDKAFPGVIEQTDKMTDAINSGTDATRRLSTANQDLIDSTNRVKDIQKTARQLTMNDLEKQLDDIDEAAKRQIAAEIEVERAKLGALKTIDDVDADVRAKIEERINKLRDDEKDAAKEANATAHSFETGWNKAYTQYAKDATDASLIAGQLFNTATKGMEDALVNFAHTGKLSFKDLANSIIDDIIRMEAKAMASNIFGLLGGDSKSGGGGGLIGAAVSGIGKMLGFAEGGPVVGGQPIIVGEKGPEIFTPNAGGGITPNSSLGIGQATYNTYNYSISAIDSKSVAQLFAENRTLLYGNVEQARKEMPFRAR